MTRNLIICFSIIFFALSGLITFKATRISVKNISYKKKLRELKSNNLSSESEDISEQNYKKRDTDKALIKKLEAKVAMLEKKLSDKNMEIQNKIESTPQELDASRNINTQTDKNLSKELSRQDDLNILTKELKDNFPDSHRIIYTIQTGSLTNITDAMKELHSLLEVLNKNELDFLRIEKIGEFYTVRLGKFDDYNSAEKYFKEIKPQLSRAVILRAYMKDDRIIKLYSNERSVLLSQ